MVAAKTTTDLLGRIRKKMLLDAADPRATDAAILEEADQWLSTTIAHLLITAANQRWVTTSLDTPIVGGQVRYPIPSRALAAGVTEILIVSGGEVANAPEIPESNRHLFLRRRGAWKAPFAYAWEDDDIVLLPEPQNSGYSLRVRFPRQPARLVPLADCARVASVGASTITVEASPPAGIVTGSVVDVVRSEPHGSPKVMDLTLTTVSGTTYTPASVENIAVGDYLPPAGSTCVVPLPELGYHVLVLETAMGLLTTLGHSARLAEILPERTAAYDSARSLLQPRNRNQTQKIVNHYAPARGGRHTRWGWGS